MSFRERISKMSDPGKFEDLATDILRGSDRKYESVIQTGVNIEGKPIRDPVDGLGQVPDVDPPHYVFLEFTTYQKSGLEDKWIANPDAEDDQSRGDLIKAADQAEEIREEIPQAEFTAVLVSNRRLDSDLVRSVWSTANDLDISVDIWDVHRLADFLQTDPDGQYIRRKHFGIEEERLSEPLLLELSEKSLKSYRESFHIPVDEAKVERPELTTILGRARGSGTSSYFMPIVGNSGFGKTVTCYQVMEKWQADEKPALRLDAEDIEHSKSLAQAIQSGLSSLQPSLNSTAGRTALQLAQGNPLLIVVDDLNRANNPPQLLSRLQNWIGGAQQETAVDGQEGNSVDSDGLPVTILCPLWPRIWGQEKRDIHYNRFAEPIKLGPLSIDLAARLVQLHADNQGRDIGEDSARKLAENVGRDPHLIGLLGQLIQAREPLEDLPETSKEVLRRYTDHAYETASEASNGPRITPDYERAVEDLSLDVMEARKMAPTWRQVQDWSNSGSDNLDEIRELTQQEQILTILDQRSESVLSFRHDRIQEFLLADASLGEIRRTDGTPSCLSDPYYHSILGTGIAYFRPSGPTLSNLCNKNPLALIDALRILNGDAAEYERKVGATFQQWMDSQGGHEELPRSLLGKTVDLLNETDSDPVIDITDSLPKVPSVLLARFRNGSLQAGIKFCNMGMAGSPRTNHSQRDSVFADAKQRWGDQYTDSLANALSTIDAEHVQGALRLAGFLARSELVTGLEECWEEHQDTPELLPAFLWASFQCCLPEHPSLLDEIFGQWAVLPSGNSIENESNEISKGDVYSELKFSITRDISDSQVQYLINAFETMPDLEYHLSLLLSRVSDPDALELVVRKRGENMREIDGFSTFATHLLDPWRPDSPRGQSLPPEPKHRMKEIWLDDENIDEVRSSAFQLWARNTQAEDIDDLRFASEKDLFKPTVYRYRLELGDEEVITSPSLDFVEHPSLLDSLPNAWCSEAFDAVDNLLSQNSRDESENLFYHLGDVLFDIPQNDAEKLLKIHWEKISNHPKFFQAALYTATSDTLELAASAYDAAGGPEGLLNHVDMNFGFNTYGKSELISKQHLVALEPYLEDMPDMDLIHIAEKANELGLEDWGTNNVQPLLSEEYRQNHYPTDGDVLQELEDLRDKEEVVREIKGWMVRFENRAESKSRAFRILEEWIQENPTVDRYRMVAEVVKNWGTRDELSILEAADLKDDRVERYYRDAKFGVQVRTLN